MNINSLVSKVLEIAKKNHNGFTLSINNLTTINSGYAVSYAATQDSFSENDLQSVVNHALSHDGIVGGWFNGKENKYYFDSSKVFTNLDDAVNFGHKNNQKAIFDLNKGISIWLENQVVTPKEYDFSTFADWMLSTASQVVKYYKGDILIDCKNIVELRNKHIFKSETVEPQGFSFYWGIRETGTWFYHVEGDNSFSLSELVQGLGAKKVFFITFWYDSSKNEIITIKDIDKETI